MDFIDFFLALTVYTLYNLAKNWAYFLTVKVPHGHTLGQNPTFDPEITKNF